MEPRIPMVLAVGLWIASGLAVATYTVIAFRETGSKAEVLIADATAGAINPLVASAATLAAEEIKPLERGRFKESQHVKSYMLSPKELGF